MGATTDELFEALGAHVAPDAVVSVARRPFAYETTHPLEQLDVELRSGRHLTLIAKDLDPGALLQAAAGARPDFLVDERREPETYVRILVPEGLDVPQLYGSAGTLLLLERIEGSVLWEHDLPAWMLPARRLAAMHRGTSQTVSELVRRAPLLRNDDRIYGLWLERALERSDGLDALRPAYEIAVRTLASLPDALLHGECYPSNVIVRDSPDQAPVFVDWEMAAVGPGVIDLAALTAGWDEASRDEIVAAYRSEWTLGLSDRDFAAALTAARLQVAVRWLGWSSTWSPPVAHARDWRAEAFAQADRL